MITTTDCAISQGTPMSKPSGIVVIKGKEYTTVAKRVQDFRAELAGYRLVTEIISRDAESVVMKASIYDNNGVLVATGHAEEFRSSSQINETSALENCETSAIGRALACFGFGGTEFASADEVANAIHQQGKGHKPTDGAWDRVSKERKNIVRDTQIQVIEYLKENRDFDAFALCESIKDADEKVALWSDLDSKQRARLKEAKNAETLGA